MEPVEGIASFPGSRNSPFDRWELAATELLKNGESFVDLRDVRRIERRRVEFAGRQNRQLRFTHIDGSKNALVFDSSASGAARGSFLAFESAVLHRYSEIYPEDGVIRERRFDNLMLAPIVLTCIGLAIGVAWQSPIVQDNRMRAALALGLALIGVLVGVAEFRPWGLRRFDTSAGKYIRTLDKSS